MTDTAQPLPVGTNRAAVVAPGGATMAGIGRATDEVPPPFTPRCPDDCWCHGRSA
ncbi:hypothetical protein [Actinacidiphila sp. ITFR-21]|uniref:hypothetical protein n=1 Tax=Actinacidiphila sp. ITFR-21 TaxID=3075199 RepID=UPI0028895260|nr:hypothetical protein [Streptomyces sp. ITFR-21]WNI19242.1 hypothetical protein RLT57_29305 [Streptomyces sp. ITFR-21]